MGSNKMGSIIVMRMNMNHYLTQQLTSLGYGSVNVMDDYPDTATQDFLDVLPAISIGTVGDIDSDFFELGTEEQECSMPIMIDIFTKADRDAQCADLVDIVRSFFKKEKRFDYIDYNLATPTSSGKFRIENTRGTVLSIVPRIYNQGIVTFSAILTE